MPNYNPQDYQNMQNLHNSGSALLRNAVDDTRRGELLSNAERGRLQQMAGNPATPLSVRNTISKMLHADDERQMQGMGSGGGMIVVYPPDTGGLTTNNVSTNNVTTSDNDNTFKTRFLRVENTTSEKATVFVQYYTRTKAGAWKWYPGTPGVSAGALSVDLEPGQAADLQDGSWRVHASKVRLWVMLENGTRMDQYKHQDLVLVSEMDQNGQPGYVAQARETYSFTIE
jgi:hypothetical protein